MAATFAKPTFSHASYASHRPEYPESLYNLLLSYHHGPRHLLIDLGCGHGLVSRALAPHFTTVIGTDPSPGMIAEAKRLLQDPACARPNVSFRPSTAEELGWLADGSADAVVAGQAAHWFDYGRLWPELGRVLRRGGTVAFWGYTDVVFPEHARATEILSRWTNEENGGEWLGGYWSFPGRAIVEGRYRDIVPQPEEGWEDVTRVEYVPSTEGKGKGVGTMFLAKRMKVGEVKDYVRTWSAFHGWQEAHPGQTRRSAGGNGDVVDLMFDEIAKAEGWDGDGEDVEVEAEWGTGLLMARKK